MFNGCDLLCVGLTQLGPMYMPTVRKFHMFILERLLAQMLFVRFSCFCVIIFLCFFYLDDGSFEVCDYTAVMDLFTIFFSTGNLTQLR